MTLQEREPDAAQLDRALQTIVEAFDSDTGTVHLLGADGLLHLAAATSGIPEAVRETIARIPVGKGMAGLAVARGRPVDACNIQTDATGDVRPGARATGLSGAVVVPIFRGSEVVGALGIGTRHERSFTEREIAELLAQARNLAPTS